MVENKDPVDPVDPVEAALDKLKPVLAQVSFGSVVGYCSGMALKKIGKVFAFVIGVGFVGIQSAVHAGYIEVDWAKIQKDAFKPIDTVRLFLYSVRSVMWYRTFVLTHTLSLFSLKPNPSFVK
jgi:uncharacterized membrane protein (Fun14 family)